MPPGRIAGLNQEDFFRKWLIDLGLRNKFYLGIYKLPVLNLKTCSIFWDCKTICIVLQSGKRLCWGCITVYWGCINVYTVHSDNLVCYRRRTTVAGTARSPSPSTSAAPTTRRRRPRSWSDSPSGKYYYAQFNQSSTRSPSAPSDWFLLRRMINIQKRRQRSSLLLGGQNWFNSLPQI